MTLWAGIIFETIEQFKGLNINRLTNNPAEYWFHKLKNKILDGKMMPSQICGLLYTYLLSKYLEFYHQQTIDQNKEKVKEKEETWKDKKAKKRKNKNGFYKNSNAFGFLDQKYTDSNKRQKAFEEEEEEEGKEKIKNSSFYSESSQSSDSNKSDNSNEEETKINFIKLENHTNKNRSVCYANASLQCLFSCENDFYEQVN